MNSQISIPLPTKSFLRLVDFLREIGSDRDPVKAVDDAIDYWISNAEWKSDDLLPELNSSALRGYSWRHKESSLFLPEGTGIRMRYKGRFCYAEVEKDEILFEGQVLSPSALTKRITGSNRNAWRDLWVKRPSDEKWMLADDLRQKEMRALHDLLGDLTTSVPEGDGK